VTDIIGFNPTNSPGLAFPYSPSNESGLKPYIRIKIDKPPVINGKPAKYLSPKGSSNRLYIPPGVEVVLKDTSKPLYLTEGEKKALKAWQEGLP
jgi:hypothetical protein